MASDAPSAFPLMSHSAVATPKKSPSGSLRANASIRAILTWQAPTPPGALVDPLESRRLACLSGNALVPCASLRLASAIGHLRLRQEADGEGSIQGPLSHALQL